MSGGEIQDRRVWGDRVSLKDDSEVKRGIQRMIEKLMDATNQVYNLKELSIYERIFDKDLDESEIREKFIHHSEHLRSIMMDILASLTEIRLRSGLDIYGECLSIQYDPQENLDIVKVRELVMPNPVTIRTLVTNGDRKGLVHIWNKADELYRIQGVDTREDIQHKCPVCRWTGYMNELRTVVTNGDRFSVCPSCGSPDNGGNGK